MESLQILTLKIKNYRQFVGENSIDLEISNTKNINVIEGENGTGKSNILNAITLCLFSDEKHQENNVEQDARLPYVSVGKLEKIESGEAVEGYVEIEMGREEPEYIFKRRFRTFKTEEGYSDVFDDLQVKRRYNRDWVTEDNPATIRNEILAARVADYFLFDGEQLQEFFDKGYQNRIRKGILDVSHIELLDQALKNHLKKVRSEIQSKAGEYEGKPKQIEQEIAEIEAEIEEKQAEKEELEKSISGTDDEIDRIDTKLQDVKDEKVKRHYEKREFLEQQLSEYEDQLKKKTKEAHKKLLHGGARILSHSALSFAKTELDEMAEKGQLPPKIRDQFIDELLEREECICGASLENDEEKQMHLMELKREVVDIGEQNFEGKAQIPILLEDAQETGDSLLEYRKEIQDLEDKISTTNSELKEVNTQLQNFDIPDEIDVGALESQRKSLKDQRDQLIKDVSRAEQTIEELDSNLTTKETELKEEMKKEARYEEITQKLDFVDAVRDDLREIRNDILEKIRTQTEENINEYFNELIWKDTEYTVLLEENYRVQVIDEHDENQLGSLSAGETQVLALAFMAALSQISGFQSPIVIDTPLGRISGEPKSQIAKNLPNYLMDSQINFLMTDQEYTSDVRALMKPHVAKEYVLDFHEGVTEVKKRKNV